jgi:Asp/Glu/hydantoin racemase
VVIACFSAHPLVEVLRELVDVPVVGIMQSSILVGSQLGGSVGVVTTDARWEPLLTREIRAAGMDRLCSAGVVSSRLRVLDLERLPRTEVVSRLCAEARRLVVERGADVVVLGCAGMVGLTEAIEREVGGGVCVVDPVRAGVEVAVGLARLGLATARSGVYQ